jgi:hypothetical protein
MAWWYRPYAPKDIMLAQLEAEARAAKRGLWADAHPVPPWEWRKPSRTPSRAGAPVTSTAPAMEGPIVGNQKSRVYHWPGCPDYDKVSAKNRITFPSREAAEHAGYRPARNYGQRRSTQAQDPCSPPTIACKPTGDRGAQTPQQALLGGAVTPPPRAAVARIRVLER